MARVESCFEASWKTARKHIIAMGYWVRDSDIDALVRHCTLPFIAYVQGEILVIDNWKDLKSLYGAHVDQINADGAFEAKISFLSHEETRNGRHAIVVKWQLSYPDACKDKALATRYLLRIDPETGEIFLELLEDVTGHETEFSRVAKEHYAKLYMK
ncbi:MAG: hypothetical protein WBB25_03705 [Sulfitobacter sp.]